MPEIFFNVRPGMGRAREQALLERLRKRPEITSAAPLRPEAKSEAVRRMFYANVESDADVTALVRELSQLPEIESASVPAERHLLSE